MKFSKISVTKKGVHLIRETKDENGAVESVDLESPERPLSEFSDALEAFVPYVVELIPFLESVEDELTITTLNLSEDKNGLRGLIVTALWPVAKAYDKPLVLNTPLVREGGENASDEAFCLTDEVLQLIALAESEAARYVKGERVQGELFTRAEATAPAEGETSENAESFDERAAAAEVASTRKPRASQNGTAAANGKHTKRGKKRKRGPRHIPGVGDVMNPEATEAPTTDEIRASLLTVGRDVPTDALAAWTSTERDAALEWVAMTNKYKIGKVKEGDVPAVPDCVERDAIAPLGDGWTDREPPRVTSDDVQNLKAAAERAD